VQTTHQALRAGFDCNFTIFFLVVAKSVGESEWARADTSGFACEYEICRCASSRDSPDFVFDFD
jgi:hypothetical protein